MEAIKYISVETILSKFYRDTRDLDISENDIIEWIGEAMEFLKVSQLLEEVVTFIEVKDHKASVPEGLAYVLQIARNIHGIPSKKECTPVKITTEEQVNTCTVLNPVAGETTEKSCCMNPLGVPVFENCYGELVGDIEPVYYRPFFDLKWEYQFWTSLSSYRDNYVPVRLSNNIFFSSLVCKENDYNEIYHNCVDEYTIIGNFNKQFLFSFKEGLVAVSFLKTRIDNETGYPLIPDQISFITAITYYIKMKVSERKAWSGIGNSLNMMQDSQVKWLKYARQAKNYMKMPKTLDEYQNILEEIHYLIPRHTKYYGFFGKLGRMEARRFNTKNR